MDVKKTVISKDDMSWNSYTQKWDVNLSDVYSILIKDAALCERHASDIIYDINNIEEALRTPDINEKEFWIGFRQFGVDSKNAIMNKLEQPEVYGRNIYRKIYYVRFEIDSGYEPDFKRGSAFGTVEFGKITL